MNEKIKTVDVTAFEWFDKVNGNSYFAGYVCINFGMDNQRTYTMPFQYGYGDHYRQMAFELLQNENEIPSQDGLTSDWRYYQEHNIIVRYVKHENCKKRELKAIAN